jgi:hypothetical protein
MIKHVVLSVRFALIPIAFLVVFDSDAFGELILTSNQTEASTYEGGYVYFTITVTNTFDLYVTMWPNAIGLVKTSRGGDDDDLLTAPSVFEDNVSGKRIEGGATATYRIKASSSDDGAPYDDGPGLWKINTRVYGTLFDMDDVWSDWLELNVDVLDFDPAWLIPGDATGDRIVDAADAHQLAMHWGMSGVGIGWDQGDFDGDQLVGPNDASILAANWGYCRPTEGLAAPEPGAIALLVCGLVACLLRRARRPLV